MLKLICDICGNEKDVPSGCDHSMILKEVIYYVAVSRQLVITNQFLNTVDNT